MYVTSFYLSHILTPGLQDHIVEDLYDFAAKVPPSTHKTRMSRGKPKVYKCGEDLITGEQLIVRSWHAIGQQVISFYWSQMS